jgi:hypothetical protein
MTRQPDTVVHGPTDEEMLAFTERIREQAKDPKTVQSVHAMNVAYDFMLDEDATDTAAIEQRLRQNLAVVDAELAALRTYKARCFADIKARVKAKKTLERALRVFAEHEPDEEEKDDD